MTRRTSLLPLEVTATLFMRRDHASFGSTWQMGSFPQKHRFTGACTLPLFQLLSRAVNFSPQLQLQGFRRDMMLLRAARKDSKDSSGYYSLGESKASERGSWLREGYNLTRWPTTSSAEGGVIAITRQPPKRLLSFSPQCDCVSPWQPRALPGLFQDLKGGARRLCCTGCGGDDSAVTHAVLPFDAFPPSPTPPGDTSPPMLHLVGAFIGGPSPWLPRRRDFCRVIGQARQDVPRRAAGYQCSHSAGARGQRARPGVAPAQPGMARPGNAGIALLLSP